MLNVVNIKFVWNVRFPTKMNEMIGAISGNEQDIN